MKNLYVHQKSRVEWAVSISNLVVLKKIQNYSMSLQGNKLQRGYKVVKSATTKQLKPGNKMLKNITAKTINFKYNSEVSASARTH